ncbi:MAG TPA: transcription antitermination factor NusB [Cryptosporangiaceae bacterium]|nr:transcription antitermination factor NusB [Cryptosporangiaceae bacterium]
MTGPDGTPEAGRGRAADAPAERGPERRSARRKARKRALDILFEADLRGTEALATARDRLAQSDPPVPEYAVTLVEGVTARRSRIDELLSTYAEGWTLDRMPPVDRNLLRIASYEMLWRDDVPDAVAIDEAVALAQELSTDESPRFVNGLLGRLQLLKAEL